MEVLKSHLIQLNLDENAMYCYNGVDALEAATSQIDNAFERYDQQISAGLLNMKVKITPIKLIIADFKMPLLNGIDFHKQLMDHIDQTNLQQDSIKVVPPIFVLTSAFLSP